MLRPCWSLAATKLGWDKLDPLPAEAAMMDDDRPPRRGRILGTLLALLGIAVLLALAMTCCARPAQAQFCSGCGCKGGPGYRGPNGQCVSWRMLDKVCGSPPATHCKAELVNARPGAKPEERTARPTRPRAPRERVARQTVPNPF